MTESHDEATDESLESMIDDLKATTEAMESLPTTDEAALGELARNPLPNPEDANEARLEAISRDPSNHAPEGFDHPLDHFLRIQRGDLIHQGWAWRDRPYMETAKPVKKALWAREAWQEVFPDTEAPYTTD